jgi:hypothetical protein
MPARRERLARNGEAYAFVILGPPSTPVSSHGWPPAGGLADDRADAGRREDRMCPARLAV